MKLAAPNKKLLKVNEEWDRKGALEYLDKRRFLELLMLAMHLTGGQPARGPELGSIKFRNSAFSLRNFFVISGKAFYVTEYHKARASTQYSYFVVRYLPRCLAELLVIYIAYIRPFCNLLFNQISVRKNSSDGDYLFCSEDSNDKCWNGKKLTEIMQRESGARSGSKINISKYRHIEVAVTRVHVKEIAGHFAKDDAVWQEMLGRNKDFNVYAWQTGHQLATNNSTYGLDQAYPCHLQPEFVNEYRRISQLWHRWLGFDDEDSRKRNHADENGAVVDSRKRSHQEENFTTPQGRRRKEFMIEDLSPASTRLLEFRREEKALRKRFNMS